jgi:hypothetical protein
VAVRWDPISPALTRPFASHRGRTCPRNGVNLVSWDQRFFDPVILPKGRKLVTLRDAAQYIMKLPKTEQQAPEWQTAAELLMLIGERDGDQ